MDELERRLSRLLTTVSERADPAATRLRNPADSARPGPARLGSGRRRSAWVTAAAAVTVAGVAVGITVGVPELTGYGEPGASASPSPSAGRSQGVSDGMHPLWSLAVVEAPSRSFDSLPVGGRVDLPVPYTVDPRSAPGLVSVPTLVTATGAIRFSVVDTKAVHLLAQRSQGSFVVVTGPGHDGEDGWYDVRFVLVAPDNTSREFYRARQAGSVGVSPDGTKLAVTTWLDDGRQQSEPVVELVDVGSGRVEHRLPGRFTQVVWASDRAILLSGPEDVATSRVWRAPWTGSGERSSVGSGGAMAVDGGLVALDEARGCLQRLDADADVIEVNCNRWGSAGQVSPGGRYVSLEWTRGDGQVRRGVLDVRQNQVRSWPAEGINPSWLGPAEVLLTQADVEDLRALARCDLTTNTCVRVSDDTHQGVLSGADWIGR